MATHTQEGQSSSDDEILSRLDGIEEVIGTLTTQIQGLHPSLKAIGAITQSVDDTKALVRQVLDTQSANQMSAAVDAGAAPPSSRRATPQHVSQLSPLTMDITIRPYKLAASSETGFALNSAPVYQCLLQLVNFESSYPGSMNAVINIIQSCMLGFEQDLAEPDLDALAKNPKYVNIMPYVQNQRMTFSNIFNSIIAPGFNMADAAINPATKATIKEAVTQVGRALTGNGMPAVADTRKNLANLFQPTGTMPGTIYKQSQQRTITKISLNQTFLGVAWRIRLPQRTREMVPFTLPMSINVPPIMFDHSVPHAGPAQPGPAPQGIGHPVDTL